MKYLLPILVTLLIIAVLIAVIVVVFTVGKVMPHECYICESDEENSDCMTGPKAKQACETESGDVCSKEILKDRDGKFKGVIRFCGASLTRLYLMEGAKESRFECLKKSGVDVKTGNCIEWTEKLWTNASTKCMGQNDNGTMVIGRQLQIFGKTNQDPVTDCSCSGSLCNHSKSRFKVDTAFPFVLVSFVIVIASGGGST